MHGQLHREQLRGAAPKPVRSRRQPFPPGQGSAATDSRRVPPGPESSGCECHFGKLGAKAIFCPPPLPWEKKPPGAPDPLQLPQPQAQLCSDAHLKQLFSKEKPWSRGVPAPVSTSTSSCCPSLAPQCLLLVVLSSSAAPTAPAWLLPSPAGPCNAHGSPKLVSATLISVRALPGAAFCCEKPGTITAVTHTPGMALKTRLQ